MQCMWTNNFTINIPKYQNILFLINEDLFSYHEIPSKYLTILNFLKVSEHFLQISTIAQR